MRDGRDTGLTGLLTPAAVIVCWQLSVTSGWLDYQYLPSPAAIGGALSELASSGELFADTAHTFAVVAVAAAVTLTIGGALGLAIGLKSGLRQHILGSVDFLRSIPAVALVPAAVLTFGPGVMTELMLASYAALWPMVLATAGGVAAVHPRHYDVAAMFGFGTTTTARKIVVPAALPAGLIGARLAVVIALLVAITTEMIISADGLGGGLVESLNALAPERMWAYVLACGMVGLTLNVALRRIPGGQARTGRVSRATAPSTVAQPVTSLRGLLPLVVLLGGWQLLSGPDSLTFPPPGQWLTALRRMSADGSLLPALGQTVGTYALGLAGAGLLGAGVGAALGASRRMDRLLTPSIDFLASVPGAASVPLAVLVLGPGPLSGVAVVAGVASWPILLTVATAMRTIPQVRLDMARSLGLSRWRRWRTVILPSLTPAVLLGLRVASGLALIVSLLFDVFGSGTGVGRLLVESQQHFDAAAAWGLLLLAGAFGYAASAALARLGRTQIIAMGDTLTPISSAPASSRLTS